MVADRIASKGPSPRARGSLMMAGAVAVVVGSIPAGAGKPGDGGELTRVQRVHPRGRGEASGR